MITDELVSNVVYALLKKASIRLPEDIKRALKRAHRKETSAAGKLHIATILRNIEIAEKSDVCVCQDTGIPLFFVKLGLKADMKCDLKEAIFAGTERATKETPLRENVIHPITKKNSGTNVGWGMPNIFYDVDFNSDTIEITAVPKGFGSESKTVLVYIPTSEPFFLQALTKCVVDNLTAAMGDPCPPYIVGVGIGGTGEIATMLAKKAYLRRPVETYHTDPIVANLEKHLLKVVNKTGIGPMGMGGGVTALAVHAEICGTHTGAVPVAMSVQCWAARQASAKITPDGKVRYLD